MLFSHIVVGSNDLEKSKNFYDALFKIVGVQPIEGPEGSLIYIRDNQFFGVRKPIDGQPATYGNGTTIGFNFDSPEQVNEWHQTGINHGGKSVEDPPGVREAGNKKMYLAYLRDPDGNKLCGFYLIS
ncbi:Predicted dioxygenase of extradiol dioxygenase family [Commensalibacter communis]|uniref:VOC family protein n=1 Tax=Commensalibacter communis TaxID=2972786 RepID=UPI0022FFB939|nr:VOC family protein [Commensalibacter communis]CAI3947041.1 Predicted dioxygenase of extradiol dioxygenase family [Commensalibacter communis]